MQYNCTVKFCSYWQFTSTCKWVYVYTGVRLVLYSPVYLFHLWKLCLVSNDQVLCCVSSVLLQTLIVSLSSFSCIKLINAWSISLELFKMNLMFPIFWENQIGQKMRQHPLRVDENFWPWTLHSNFSWSTSVINK